MKDTLRAFPSWLSAFDCSLLRSPINPDDERILLSSPSSHDSKDIGNPSCLKDNPRSLQINPPVSIQFPPRRSTSAFIQAHRGAANPNQLNHLLSFNLFFFSQLPDSLPNHSFTSPSPFFVSNLLQKKILPERTPARLHSEHSVYWTRMSC